MKFPTLKDMDFKAKKAIVRVDYNVPLDDEGNMTSDKRIRSSLPTLNYLLDNGAKVIIMTSVGRPKGKVDEKLRTTKIAEKLSDLIGKDVKKADDCIGEEVKKTVDELGDGEIIMLENLRFHKEEEENDDNFAKELAGLADIYVNNAFANSHREHASMHAITKFLPGCAGLLVEKEVTQLLETLQNPEQPFIAIMGGVKLETKIPVLKSILKKTKKVLLGGAMIFTFYKAQGLEVGDSKVDEEKIGMANEFLDEFNDKIVLPVDIVLAEEFKEDADAWNVDVSNLPPEGLGLDIGPKTIELFREELQNAKTVFWNGPMGVFEFEKFSNGTKEMAKILAELDAKTIIGGGDSAAAIEKLNMEDRFTWISTGGGASLMLIEKGTLPALKALEKSQ